MTVLLGTGLRVGGLQALRLRDVKRNQIHVSWESAKGEKAMRVGAVPNRLPSKLIPFGKKTRCKRAFCSGGRYADGNGLYLVVAESGARRWLLRTVIAGKRRDIGLGSVRLVELAKARVEAARMRLIARTGGDPLTERRRERRTMLTFEEAAKQVHAAHAATFRNAKHQAQWLSSLKM